jgi:hypothetical protein
VRMGEPLVGISTKPEVIIISGTFLLRTYRAAER